MLKNLVKADKDVILVTGHRRENQDERVVKELLLKYIDGYRSEVA